MKQKHNLSSKTLKANQTRTKSLQTNNQTYPSNKRSKAKHKRNINFRGETFKTAKTQHSHLKLKSHFIQDTAK